MYDKSQLLAELALFDLGSGGIGSWVAEVTNSEVAGSLGEIETNPLSKVKLN
jgi:hypothetical protein